jgi:predicted choloylglycine hydrolase
MKGFFITVLGLILLTAQALEPARATESGHRYEENILAKASLSYDGDLPVLKLRGTPYEIGFQHGRLLEERVRQANRQMLQYFTAKLMIPIVGEWVVYFLLDRTYNQLKPYIPQDFLEEMRGLADGSGVPLRMIQRLHAVPDLYSTLCASGAFHGPATKDGRLLHLRNLDWNREIGIQDYAAIFAVHKEGKVPFVNIGYVSFIGALSGMNAEGISIGQIGSESRDATLEGTPMPLLLRRVLEEARDLDQAVSIVQNARRTIGCNYVFADAKEKRACAVETTAHHAAVFYENDPKEERSTYAQSLENGVLRADFAVDPAIRDLQTCAGGNPKKPGLEDPRGTGAYDRRYAGQAVFVREKYGLLDDALMVELARTVAPGSNVQSVIYSFPEFRVANARGKARAADAEYHTFNVEKLLAE